MSQYRLFKHSEREIARRLGGQRTGHHGGADIDCGWLAVEVKTRRQLPAWLTDAMAQSRRNANDEQLGIVVLHEAGKEYGRAIVCVELADFQSYFGGDHDPGQTAPAGGCDP